MALRVLRALAASFCVAAASEAQIPERKLAADVARDFMNAVERGKWTDAAQLLDVEPIERSRQSMLAWERRRPKEPEPTVEEIMRQDPEMPRAVAEYELAQTKRRRDAMKSHFAHTFADVTDTVMLAGLQLIELAARWLEAQDARYQLRQAHRTSPTCRNLPEVRDEGSSDMNGRSIVATIEVGDTAYVLFTDVRNDRSGAREMGSPPRVMELKRIRGRWLIVPSHEIARNSLGLWVMCEVRPDSTRKRPNR